MELDKEKYAEWSLKRLEILEQMNRMEKIMDMLAEQATSIANNWKELNRQLSEIGLEDD